LPEGQTHYTYGHSKKIQYIPAENLVKLEQDAHLEQNGNIIQGPLITYNTKTQLAESPSTAAGATTIILPPYDQEKRLYHNDNSTKPAKR